MFKPREDKEDVTKVVSEPPKSLVLACKQIVDCLVRHILVLEEDGHNNPEGPQPRTTTQRILACHKTLYLFAKIRPQLLVDHAITLQPYLAWRCQVRGRWRVESDAKESGAHFDAIVDVYVGRVLNYYIPGNFCFSNQ